MKRLVLALALITLVSCKKEVENNSVTISKDEYEGLKSQDREYPKPFSTTEIPQDFSDEVIVLGSDGHEYINSRNTTILMHWPECSKCKIKEEELKSLLIQVLNKNNTDTLK
jgi:hypothetical protein